ncbi:hypothetical protein KCU78_g13910, partial [Aureobasidium melanogenum]
MQFLRLQGIPIPEIFDWASSAENPVGSEYIVMAKAKGKHTQDVLRSVGERELAWLEKFAKPRFPREPLYREFYDRQKVDPEVQKQNLRQYLDIAQLMVPEQAKLHKPTIRHPDLSPGNVFVSDGNITGLIDWQHTSVLPLFLQAKLPKHFQNWGDEDSENLKPPRLPDDFDCLTMSEQEAEQEKYRRRQLHYFYVAYTRRNNKLHFDAISKPHLVMVSRLFDIAGQPWEGNNVSLKAEIIKTLQHWPDLACTVPYTTKERSDCLAIDEKQQEADAQMQVLRECFNINIDGWVPSDLYDLATSRADDVKEQMMRAADTDEERREIQDNWPFQDHVEID